MEQIKNELFDIILKNSSPTMVVKRTIDYQQTMAIVAEFITHESDLLKEFVEYLYGKFKSEDYCVSIELGRIKQELENFLKEKK